MTAVHVPRVEFGVAVRSPDEAATFYERSLGFERVRAIDLPPELTQQLGLGTTGRLVWLRGPDGSVLKFMGGQGARDLVEPSSEERTPSHFVTVYVEDLDLTLRETAAHGATSVGPVATGPTEARLAFVRDPSGNLVELVQPPADD